MVNNPAVYELRVHLPFATLAAERKKIEHMTVCHLAVCPNSVDVALHVCITFRGGRCGCIGGSGGGHGGRLRLKLYGLKDVLSGKVSVAGIRNGK